jgi:hypothetical protein
MILESMLLFLNVLFCGFYYFTRYISIMDGNFEWLDEKPFTFDQTTMQIHVIFGLWLHILAIFRIIGDNHGLASMWTGIIVANVLMMNIAGLYSPHSRNLPAIEHWTVSIILSVLSIMGIWYPIIMMGMLWILDCISFILFFDRPSVLDMDDIQTGAVANVPSPEDRSSVSPNH